jgi:hypothetical protein
MEEMYALARSLVVPVLRFFLFLFFFAHPLFGDVDFCEAPEPEEMVFM